ncbi:MAG: hypothetical protein DRN53_02765 [Thermoprotei archaeon]|nr:MAG: hypothetical protein DRN53_02765 [Thermoprotei archaeon]
MNTIKIVFTLASIVILISIVVLILLILDYAQVTTLHAIGICAISSTLGITGIILVRRERKKINLV